MSKKDDQKICLTQTAFLSVLVAMFVWMTVGCTVVVRHEYPAIVPPPEVLDDFFEKMDYA